MKFIFFLIKQKNLLTILILISLSYSCSTQNLFESPKKVSNLKELQETENSEYVIRVDDKLSLSIWGHDDLSIGSVFGNYSSNEVYGKWILIDQRGDAIFPKIGKVRLLGVTVSKAEERLTKLYERFLKEPIVMLRVLNRKVSVLGEVQSPGNYILEKQTNNLIEMIGQAGGFGFYADKREIKIIRKNKEYVIDLTAMDLTQENIPLLKADDVVYIPARRGKFIDKQAPTIIPFASLLTSILMVLSFWK